MYKRPLGKTKKKIIKALALSRRLLVGFGDALINGSSDISPLWYHSSRRGLTMEEKYFAKQAEIKRALYDLKRRKFIEIRKQGNRVFCILTAKGKLAAMKDRVRIADGLSGNYICMLSFDIPEQERHVRQQVRRLLKDWGFKMDHQSLWVSKKDIFAPFSDYLKQIGVYKWFRLYRAEQIK